MLFTLFVSIEAVHNPWRIIRDVRWIVDLKRHLASVPILLSLIIGFFCHCSNDMSPMRRSPTMDLLAMLKARNPNIQAREEIQTRNADDYTSSGRVEKQ